MVDETPSLPKKGRGAVRNDSGRYERYGRIAIDDGWERPAEVEFPDENRPVTIIGLDTSRTIISHNTSPDIPFDRSINPYKGCEHGCIYCYARPTHAYLGLSPGLDFETRIFAKPDAALLLEKAFRQPRYRPAVISLGANTDPYQPIERQRGITRSVLEVLERFGHPVGIVTKSALVTRDIDILARMAERRLVSVFLSITTLDRDLARSMEPRAATPPRRLEALRLLSQAGIPVGVMAAPMIPALNDHELESILEAAVEAGARSASYVLLRLPLEIKDLFADWLTAHQPGRAKHVLSLVRDTRGGALYRSDFGTRMRGEGPYAQLLEQRFRAAVRRYGLNRHRWDLDLSQFSVPPLADGAEAGGQLTLF
ncbi:MAG: PA0069 family radical SAM protein [Alphaproteobacteria bacterium]|nr:PA0069 family radical SAM protein [Alphaproteobacteria bacterium]MBU0798868.1 PA0069 family radical SAM protein [Alphaproteobacteria bacterium]MBU0888718.1 PA0069 family radical SAM protein [Alphaproteobacteria bacterium]MBU1813548.1 PA0069 family radical SAM protein [Alphaproteobacteria bacterium]